MSSILSDSTLKKRNHYKYKWLRFFHAYILIKSSVNITNGYKNSIIIILVM